MIIPAMLLIYSFRFSTRPHNSGVLLRSFVTIIVSIGSCNSSKCSKRNEQGHWTRCKSALISLLDRDKEVFITSLIKIRFEQFYSPTLLRAIILGFKFNVKDNRTVLLILLNMVKKSYILRCRVAQFF